MDLLCPCFYSASCESHAKTVLTAVSVLTTLVSLAALTILLVPPVAAVLTFAAYSLYIVLMASSLLAVVSALGACLLGSKEAVQVTHIERLLTLKKQFEQNPNTLYFPLKLNYHTYYLLNPAKYQDCSTNPAILKEKLAKDRIVEEVSLGDQPLTLSIRCDHFLKGNKPHLLESVNQVKKIIFSHQGVLITAQGYSEYNLCVTLAEYMIFYESNRVFLSKYSVQFALEQKLCQVERAIGHPTDIDIRQAFLSERAVEGLMRFLTHETSL